MSATLTVEEIEIKREFNRLMQNSPRLESRADRSLVKKAYKMAYDAHKGTRRKSGEPYILHPIAVAQIVSHEMGLGAKSMACALLHDVVEDTEYTLDDMTNLFGPKIASIIDGLTKISGVFDNKSSLQAENFRKMLLTMSDDVRTILIKIADRLHNMRTLDSMPRNKQVKIASETIYLYAPLAHRLGLYAIKSELEDLSLKYRHPKIYKELADNIKSKERSRLDFLEEFKEPIVARLTKNNYQFEISARHKSIHSIWQKMQNKKVPFEEVYDLMAIRIVFEPHDDIPEKTQCWNLYSMITDIYMPKPERIRDWVSTPKANGYEALHATLMGPNGTWIEVQIRSRRMDEIAEKGLAAHWKYKDQEAGHNELDKWLQKIRDLLENPQSDALEFLDDFKLNLFASEIFVFTPRGDLKTMPINATILDFAYDVHSEIGHKAIGGKINHKLVSLSHNLSSGDQIEIITSDSYQPRRDWLNKVSTAKAKSSIKALLKAENRNRIEKGKKIIEDKLRPLKLVPNHRIIRKLLIHYSLNSKDELYSQIGIGIIHLNDLKKVLKKNTKNKWIRYWSLQLAKTSAKTFKTDTSKKGKKVNGSDTLKGNQEKEEPTKYVIPKCCNPIPGDDVSGFIQHNGTVVIHLNKCPEAVKLLSSQSKKLVDITWTRHKYLSFLAKLALNGIDRFGIYNDITTVISKQLNVNIRNIHLESHDGIWDGTIQIYVHNTKDLNNLMMNLNKLKGVDTVTRIEDIRN